MLGVYVGKSSVSRAGQVLRAQGICLAQWLKQVHGMVIQQLLGEPSSKSHQDGGTEINMSKGWKGA